METRKDILLRAAYDLLKRNFESDYIKSAMETLTYYDGTSCDGACLMDDIAMELGIDDGTRPIPLCEE